MKKGKTLNYFFQVPSTLEGTLKLPTFDRLCKKYFIVKPLTSVSLLFWGGGAVPFVVVSEKKRWEDILSIQLLISSTCSWQKQNSVVACIKGRSFETLFPYFSATALRSSSPSRISKRRGQSRVRLLGTITIIKPYLVCPLLFL